MARFIAAAVSLSVALTLGNFALSQQPAEAPKEPPPYDLAKRFPLDKIKNPEGLRLEIAAAKTAIKEGEQPAFTVRLINAGKQDVTLVTPGDGSEVGWRMPAVQWLANGLPPQTRILRCGNMNPFQAEEIFKLKAGEERVINYGYRGPHVASLGTTKVSLRFVNVPDFVWRNESGKEADAIKLVRTTNAGQPDQQRGGNHRLEVTPV